MSSSGPISIMFIDDEPKILASLRRMLRGVRNEWEAFFANSGPEALEMLDGCPFDVIVSDIRMPHMSGVELLQEVRRRYPGTIRIVLSGQASRESVFAAAGPTHQYLPKPCSFNLLKGTVDRIIKLSQTVADDELRSMICGLASLPSLPEHYDTVIDELRKPQPSRKTLETTVSADAAMAAKMMQLVSSGFFGPPQAITDPAEVVQLLGLDVMRTLTLDVGIFRRCDTEMAENLNLTNQWQHACEVAACARMVAKACGASAEIANAACHAGYMHGVGRPLLAQHYGSRYAECLATHRDAPTSMTCCEQERFGVTHGQAAAYLTCLWGLATHVVTAVQWLDNPSQADEDDGELSALAITHAATAVVRNARGQAPQMDETYLGRRGLLEKIPKWTEQWTAQNSAEVNHV